MKYSDLKAGQKFIIKGRKTPRGFIAEETGEAFYEIDGNVPVSDKQSVRTTALQGWKILSFFEFITIVVLFVAIFGGK